MVSSFLTGAFRAAQRHATAIWNYAVGDDTSGRVDKPQGASTVFKLGITRRLMQNDTSARRLTAPAVTCQ